MLEGEILKAAAEKEKQKDIEAALRARRQAQERNLEMVRANDALQEYKAVQADRERMADEQIAGQLPAVAAPLALCCPFPPSPNSALGDRRGELSH